MSPVGMLSLFDPPRDDTAETIRLANEYGVGVRTIQSIYSFFTASGFVCTTVIILQQSHPLLRPSLGQDDHR